MKQKHWMLSLVRLVAIISVLVASFIVLWYTPYYSKIVVSLLDRFVPIEVNQVAAKSQQMAALTDHENLEPSSNLWLARQAYLEKMEQSIHQDVDTEGLVLIQARYKLLQQKIVADEKQDNKTAAAAAHAQHAATSTSTSTAQLSNPSTQALNLSGREQLERHLRHAASEVAAMDAASMTASEATTVAALKIKQEQQRAAYSQQRELLKEKYLDYLNQAPVDQAVLARVAEQFSKDFALIQDLRKNKAQSNKAPAQPYAIVVLGGGLTLDQNHKDIVVNEYTRLRLETTLALEKRTNLPIVLSGVEAPYMQAWLIKRGVDAKLIENKSMNTCENTRFSSLLLQKKVGAPTVLLVTDRYHMPRTRRLFAINGIETIAVESPMPTQLTAWQPSQQNYDHSRRANYEMLATIRDVVLGNSGCREVP